MQNEKLNNLIVLEAIRSTGNSVPYPVSGDWGYLQEDIERLLEEGYLSNDSDTVKIDTDGKKFVLMFDAQRKDLLEPLEVYKEVRIGDRLTDARLPLEAFKLRKMKREIIEEHLYAMACLVIWKDFFDAVKRLHEDPTSNWQKELIPAFKENVERYAKGSLWETLGGTAEEAVQTAERLLNPTPKKDLIEITRI